MASLSNLDCLIVYYHDNAKMTRIPCNFLLAEDLIKSINQYWVNNEQRFYTHVEIEYQINDKWVSIYKQKFF